MARAATRTRSRTRSNKITIPSLGDVETSTVLPVGDYLFEVVEVEQDEGDKGPYLKWTFEVAEGKLKGSKAKPYITSFAENALFNLKNVLTALGVDIPDDEFDIDKDELIGLQCMGSIEHDSYQGRKQSVIVDFFSADEEPEEKPARGKAGKGKSATGRNKKEPELEAISEADINGMDQDELEGINDEYELELDFAKLKTPRKMRAAVIDALTEKDLIAE